MSNRVPATVAMASAILFAAGAAASAQDITLKMATVGPTTHIFNTQGAEPFMERVKELTGGKVDFEYYPAEQLGKSRDYLTLTNTGLADISQIVPSYYSEKMPLSTVPGLPGLASDSCSGTNAVWALIDTDKQIADELKANGIIPLVAWVMVPYQVSTSKAELKKIVGGELNGLKIRATAGVLDLVLRELDAIPVSLAAPEIRDALDRGTIDGAFGTFTTNIPYQLTTLLDYQTVGAPFGAYSAMLSISARKYDSLPADVQEALKTAGRETSTHLCEQLDATETKSMAQNEKDGVTLVKLDAAQKVAIGQALEPIQSRWLASQKERGISAEGVLKAYKAALPAN